jgi:GntR family transcriptional regulator, transcriptional repressor for pyruvate dehydrogenase complex
VASRRQWGAFMEPVVRESVIDIVTQRIVEHVRSRSLRPGDRLPSEKELAQELQVSRASIREAVRSLVATGLLEQQHGLGTFVARPTLLTLLAHGPFPSLLSSIHELEDYFQTRRVLEPEMVAIAALRATPADLEAMETAFEAMECEAAEGNLDPQPLRSFHDALLQATGNQVMIELLGPINQLMSQMQREIVPAVVGPSPRDFWLNQRALHRKLFEAVRSHDPEEARKATIEHVDDAAREVRRILAERKMADPVSVNSGRQVNSDSQVSADGQANAGF